MAHVKSLKMFMSTGGFEECTRWPQAHITPDFGSNKVDNPQLKRFNRRFKASKQRHVSEIPNAGRVDLRQAKYAGATPLQGLPLRKDGATRSAQIVIQPHSSARWDLAVETYWSFSTISQFEIPFVVFR